MNRKHILIAGLCCLLAVGFGGWFVAQRQASRQFADRLPAAIRQEMDFPVYLPKTSDTIVGDPTYSSGTLLLTVTSAGASYVVSEQAQDNNFDLNKFKTGEGLAQADDFALPIGKAIGGELQGRQIVIIAAGKSIITITASGNISTDVIRNFAGGFRQLQ